MNGSSMTLSTIQLQQVCKSYGDAKVVHALRDIDLSVAQGERVAVMGPSGSGKSSLLNLICGLDETEALPRRLYLSAVMRRL